MGRRIMMKAKDKKMSVEEEINTH